MAGWAEVFSVAAVTSFGVPVGWGSSEKVCFSKVPIHWQVRNRIGPLIGRFGQVEFDLFIRNGGR